MNTHRRNILQKTGKAYISDLIYDLKERGLLQPVIQSPLHCLR